MSIKISTRLACVFIDTGPLLKGYTKYDYTSDRLMHATLEHAKPDSKAGEKS